MGNRIERGWVYNSSTRKYEKRVYNASGDLKTIYNEDGAVFQEGVQITATGAELNKLAGLATTADELNKLAGLATTAAELNKLAGLETTADELGYLDASTNGAVTRYSKAPLTIVEAVTANDTAVVIPAGSIIKNVWLDIETAEDTGTTKTVDVGISGGDEDGFLDGVSVAATGTVKGTLLNTGQTKGVLLTVDGDGAGALVPEEYVCSAATTICYTLGSDNFAELVGNVIVEWVYIP